MDDWLIFRGDGTPHDGVRRLPPPPPWRDFRGRGRTGATYRVGDDAIKMVNAALYLRRPLLVTGTPGVGKSTLARAVADELGLGTVLRWPINSRSTLADGLYQYDALARLRDATLRERGDPTAAGTVARALARLRGAAQRDRVEDIGRYVRLGPLGTALFPSPTPRVLLVDEIDKSDSDLPNDLLHVFEEGEYEIPELARVAAEVPQVKVLPADGRAEADRVTVVGGRVQADAFPFVVVTSNGERELPPAFLRRCLRLDIVAPDEERLAQIVTAHLGSVDAAPVRKLLADFVALRDRDKRLLATDQLLNAVYLVTQAVPPDPAAWEVVSKAVLRELGQS